MKANTPKAGINSQDSININKVSLFLNGPIRKEQIEKIITVPTNKVPSDVLGSWDVTNNPNNKEEIKGKVMAWYKDENDNGSYEIFHSSMEVK